MDTLFGLPAHILIVHLVVVVLPVAGLLAIATAARPSWAFYLRWPLLGAAVVGTAGALLAQSAGEQLEHRIGRSPEISAHADAGDLLVIVAFVFLGAVVLLLLTAAVPSPLASGRGGYAGRGPVTLAHVLRVVLVAAAVWLIVQTIRTGHSGSSAAWADLIEHSVPGG